MEVDIDFEQLVRLRAHLLYVNEAYYMNFMNL